MSTRTAAPPISPTIVTATWRRDLLVALAGLWPVGGLYLDGWAHTHVPQLETFFTPWHAVLYSGFLVLAFSLVPTEWWRRRAPVRAAVPARYALGLIGAVMFALGGVADMTWHTLLGIEIDLEALLSPPHLVLMTAGILMIGTPLRSAAARRTSLSQPPPSQSRPASLNRPVDYLPAVISAFSVTAVAAFFLEYVSPFVDARVADIGPGWQAAGVAEYLIITVLLVVPVLYAWTRLGRVPPGMIVAVTLAAAVPVGIFNDFHVLAGQLWVLPGALVAEVMVLLVAGARLAPFVAGLAIPGLIWPLHILGVATTIGLTWSVELWGGTIVLCALVGASLGGLLLQVTADRPQ